MGISDNLRKFMDPTYSEYDSNLSPKTEAEAAQRWTEAIAPELGILLAPMTPAQLNSLGITSFNINPSDITLPNQFNEALDSAIESAADTVFDISGACQPPPASLDSKNTIFDTNPENGLEPQYTTTEICERAENSIIAWLMTGTFTSFYYPPGSTGSPLTPWVLPPGESLEAPDTDGDGFTDPEEDEAGTEIDNKDSFPED